MDRRGEWLPDGGTARAVSLETNRIDRELRDALKRIEKLEDMVSALCVSLAKLHEQMRARRPK